MTMLLGYLAPPDGAPTRATAQAMAERAGLPENAVQMAENGAAERPAAAMAGATVHRQDGLLAAVAGRPLWRDGRLAALASDISPAAALAAAYGDDPERWVHHVGGHFAVAVIDPGRGEAQLAVDRLGVQALYYGVTNAGALVFGTGAAPLLGFPGIDGRLSPQGIYHYAYFHMVPGPGTIYRGLQKLPPAARLHFGSGAPRLDTYWCPTFAEDGAADIAELSRELHDTLFRSVAADAAGGRPVGAYLSGGLDSSTVTGKLAETQPGADTFSIGFDAEGYDETPYARATASHFGARPHEYYVTPEDVVAGVQRIAGAYDEPFGNSSALPAYYCARMARDHGIDVLLAGDGGDEIFAGNERYVTQEVFERYGRAPAPLRGLMDLPFAALPFLKTLPLLRKAHSYITQAKVPLPDRLQRYNFLHRMATAEMFSADFLAGVDQELPLELQRNRYREPAEASRVNRMLYFDWKFTLADNDLRKVNRTAELAGVEVRYPMISDGMVELSCRIPTRLKLKDNRLRWFYRQAMEGYLPDQVLRKSKHGFGLPFGVWMADYAPLRDLATHSLERQKGAGIFRPEFLDRLLEMHRTGHAAYYGELVWVIMMLDLWLETHDGHP
ncbi:MAG: asparagine synthase C-terminal domain-containing protein [Gammaproteobacteria bacterium]|nr:asparagine synthase C-terminal domain-containing protein [Gammaproteobacteria bacterium]